MRVLGTLATLGLATAMAGCYSPQIRDCVNTCEASLACPAGLDCVEGFCRLPGATTVCAQDGDGSSVVVDGPEIDARPRPDGWSEPDARPRPDGWSEPDGGFGPDAAPRPDAACGGGTNACGGSCELFGAPGDPCDSTEDQDSCADDQLACSGPEALACVNAGTDWDQDGYSIGEDACGGDCNDGFAGVNPGAQESCDELDDDCDGTTDEGGSPCGGACPLVHAPGAACDSGGDADSCTDDVYVCAGLNAVTCQNAGTDGDGDGWSVCPSDQTGLGDCVDNDGYANPGSNDECWDCDPNTCLAQGYVCQCGDSCGCEGL